MLTEVQNRFERSADSLARHHLQLQHFVRFPPTLIMPEYVYALHDFTPENTDEISFRAGDRIEVIEKDDQYGDGWWQVRQLSCGQTIIVRCC